MIKTEAPSDVVLPKRFTDVLFLTNQEQMPSEIKRLLKHKKLSFLAMPMSKFPQIRDRLDLIGTVVIDLEGLDILQEQKLARVIEFLEMENIGIALLNNLPEMPMKSFSLAPAKKSFSMADVVETVSMDELWVNISLNLAYRKKAAGIAAKPAVPEEQAKGAYINNLAEQFRKTESLVDNLSEQLRLAGLVQRDFLPDRLPNSQQLRWAATFIPAEWVSGDIYDIMRLDEDHIGFYIADVVGHSVPAAILTIFLKQTMVMRETIGNDYRVFSPLEVMGNLNVRMAAQKLSGYQFATCCYCLLNTSTLELTYCRAGHPYPILIRSDCQPQQLEIRGSLLGIFEHAEYIQQTIQLQQGDKLILHSDGAESFIGSCDDLTGFRFKQRFCEIKDLPIIEMFDELGVLARNNKVNPAEVDDITVVGLEIL